MAITQTIRCYSPADLRLLLEGMGLSVVHAEVKGTAFEISGSADHKHPLWDAWDYLVTLKADEAGVESSL